MVNDNITVSGELRITLKDSVTNEIKEIRSVKNLVVNVGKAFIASRMLGSTALPMSHMSIGTSQIAPLLTDIALGAEIARVSISTATVASRTASFIATFPAGTGTGPIVEAGIFNAASVGAMLCRTKFDVFNKAAEDILIIEWDVTIN